MAIFMKCVFGAALFCAMAATPALARGLSCGVATGSNDVTVCATAADFGWQAAHLRDTLQSRNAFRLSGRSVGQGGQLSTQGASNPYSGLASLSAQRTSGGFDGNAANLILGVDRALQSGDVVLGAMVQFGQSQITAPLSPTVERDEVMVGPYMTAILAPDLYLDGFLLYGKPDYVVGGVPSSGDAWIGGLTLTKAIQRQTVDILPFASLAIKRETPNAATRIDATVLTLGTSVRFAPVAFNGGQRQTFSRFELDFGRYSDNLGTSIDYVAPRIALGADFAFDGGGSLRMAINGSYADDGTNIVAAQLLYRMAF